MATTFSRVPILPGISTEKGSEGVVNEKKVENFTNPDATRTLAVLLELRKRVMQLASLVDPCDSSGPSECALLDGNIAPPTTAENFSDLVRKFTQCSETVLRYLN